MRSRYPPLHNPSGVVRLSNAFVFFQFRTFVRDSNVLNPFPSNTLRTTLVTTEGWGRLVSSPSHQSPITSHGAFFCFQSLTNCPICKSRVLITMQQYPGWWGQGREGKVLLEPIKRKRMPALSTAEGSQQSERQSF